MKIDEDGEGGAPTNPTTTTAGVPPLPQLPISFRNVNNGVLRRAAVLKKKKLVKEELNISADILFCTDTNETVFLET